MHIFNAIVRCKIMNIFLKCKNMNIIYFRTFREKKINWKFYLFLKIEFFKEQQKNFCFNILHNIFFRFYFIFCLDFLIYIF